MAAAMASAVREPPAPSLGETDEGGVMADWWNSPPEKPDGPYEPLNAEAS